MSTCMRSQRSAGKAQEASYVMSDATKARYRLSVAHELSCVFCFESIGSCLSLNSPSAIFAAFCCSKRPACARMGTQHPQLTLLATGAAFHSSSKRTRVLSLPQACTLLAQLQVDWSVKPPTLSLSSPRTVLATRAFLISLSWSALSSSTLTGHSKSLHESGGGGGG